MLLCHMLGTETIASHEVVTLHPVPDMANRAMAHLDVSSLLCVQGNDGTTPWLHEVLKGRGRSQMGIRALLANRIQNFFNNYGTLLHRQPVHMLSPRPTLEPRTGVVSGKNMSGINGIPMELARVVHIDPYPTLGSGGVSTSTGQISMYWNALRGPRRAWRLM
jgi:hypothetical protein